MALSITACLSRVNGHCTDPLIFKIHCRLLPSSPSECTVDSGALSLGKDRSIVRRLQSVRERGQKRFSKNLMDVITETTRISDMILGSFRSPVGAPLGLNVLKRTNINALLGTRSFVRSFEVQKRKHQQGNSRTLNISQTKRKFYEYFLQRRFGKSCPTPKAQIDDATLRQIG